MGASHSNQQEASGDRHRITVVNLPSGQEPGEEEIVLPPRALPILSVDGYVIDQERHKQDVQLDRNLWLEFVSNLNEFSNSRADLISTRQSQLQEKIIRLDDHVQRFTDAYINDKHRALAKMNDDCRRVIEINESLQKYTIQSELCIDMLNKLNFLLPEGNKLERLAKSSEGFILIDSTERVT